MTLCLAVTEIVPIATSSCTTRAGRVLREGETLTLDRCALCLCHNGALLCQVESCPPILCHKPRYQYDHSCCPICPGEPTQHAPVYDVCNSEQCSCKAHISSYKSSTILVLLRLCFRRQRDVTPGTGGGGRAAAVPLQQRSRLRAPRRLDGGRLPELRLQPRTDPLLLADLPHPHVSTHHARKGSLLSRVSR